MTTKLREPSANDSIDIDLFPTDEPLSNEQIGILSEASGLSEEALRQLAQVGGLLVRGEFADTSGLRARLDNALVAYSYSPTQDEKSG